MVVLLTFVRDRQSCYCSHWHYQSTLHAILKLFKVNPGSSLGKRWMIITAQFNFDNTFKNGNMDDGIKLRQSLHQGLLHLLSIPD